LELKTDASLKELKNKGLWMFDGQMEEFEVHQITTQGVKDEK
jgi:hypothetical protein